MARSHCQGNIFDITLQVMFVLRPKGNKELDHSHTRYEGGFQAKVLRQVQSEVFEDQLGGGGVAGASLIKEKE